MKQIQQLLLIPGMISILGSTGNILQAKEGGGEKSNKSGNQPNVKEDPNEWYNLAADEKYRPIMQNMQKSAPKVFAPGVTPKNELKLVIEGDSFHWEKKAKKQD